MANDIKEITKLPKQLADQAIQQGSTAESAEMLDALEAVAKLLGDNAGANTSVKELATQVQALVQSKRNL